jgi:hypothetical protein
LESMPSLLDFFIPNPVKQMTQRYSFSTRHHKRVI